MLRVNDVCTHEKIGAVGRSLFIDHTHEWKPTTHTHSTQKTSALLRHLRGRPAAQIPILIRDPPPREGPLLRPHHYGALIDRLTVRYSFGLGVDRFPFASASSPCVHCCAFGLGLDVWACVGAGFDRQNQSRNRFPIVNTSKEHPPLIIPPPPSPIQNTHTYTGRLLACLRLPPRRRCVRGGDPVRFPPDTTGGTNELTAAVALFHPCDGHVWDIKYRRESGG